MADLTLRELKNAAAENMYATFEKEMKQKPLLIYVTTYKPDYMQMRICNNNSIHLP
jgi:hypothetical protein